MINRKLIIFSLSILTIVGCANSNSDNITNNTNSVNNTRTVVNTSDAEALFNAKCKVCHSTTQPTDFSKVVAPMVFGVMRHVKMKYPNRDEAVRFMVDYALNPSKDKAVCMPQKIARFGLMPSQKGNVTKEELQKITSWMFDNFPPANFKGHGRGMR
jgi:cytochrome c